MRGLSADRFETLVRTAREGAARRARSAPPRLLRARHFARWESGVLVGRSELVVEPSAAGPSALVLEPWTPAIEPPADGSTPLRVQDSGRTTLLVEASEDTTLELPWQLRARPRSKGRGFTLGLPATDTASLRLDLPEGWVPEGPEGIRQGPEPGPGTGRATWRFDGRGGLIDLRLRARDKGRDPSRDPRIWVSGPTRIELREASANWTTEWSVSVEPRGPRRFAFELDPGLELIDVNGPGVDEYRVESLGPATRVTVALAERRHRPDARVDPGHRAGAGRGHLVGPGRPAARCALDGGRDDRAARRVAGLAGLRPEAGRRIAARPGEPSDADALVFEAEAPWSVATLVFRRPGPTSRSRSGASSCWATRPRGWRARSPGGSIGAACSASTSTCPRPGCPTGSRSRRSTSRWPGTPRSCPTAGSASTWSPPRATSPAARWS